MFYIITFVLGFALCYCCMFIYKFLSAPKDIEQVADPFADIRKRATPITKKEKCQHFDDCKKKGGYWREDPDGEFWQQCWCKS